MPGWAFRIARHSVSASSFFPCCSRDSAACRPGSGTGLFCAGLATKAVTRPIQRLNTNARCMYRPSRQVVFLSNPEATGDAHSAPCRKPSFNFLSDHLPQANVVVQRKRARRECPAAPRLRVDSENELAAQFQRTWILGARDLTKVAVCVLGVNAVELRVVESVERFEAELEVRPFRHRKRLVE